MDGAVWRDPEHVQEWMRELSKSEPVVVFCVYGFHVGCETAKTLRGRRIRCPAYGGRAHHPEGDQGKEQWAT